MDAPNTQHPGFKYALLEGRPLWKIYFFVNMRDHGAVRPKNGRLTMWDNFNFTRFVGARRCFAVFTLWVKAKSDGQTKTESGGGEWGIFDILLYKGIVGSTEGRVTTRVWGHQRKNRAGIESGAVIWAPSYPQKSQQIPPSQCGALNFFFTRSRAWDCIKHFIFRWTCGLLNDWVMVCEKNFLSRIWTF